MELLRTSVRNLAGLVTIAIGTGMWVEGRRDRSVWNLLVDAVKLERGEVGALAASVFRPAGAGEVLRILGQIALIDAHLDRREKQFIESFAWEWGIPLSWEEIWESQSGDPQPPPRGGEAEARRRARLRGGALALNHRPRSADVPFASFHFRRSVTHRRPISSE